jgi:hypothetical protein
MCGRDYHSRHRQVDHGVADEAKIPLPDHLTRDSDGVASGFASIGENAGTHRCLL